MRGWKHAIVILCLLFTGVSLLARDPMPEERPRIGLVLSGGGAKGLAHIGVLKVLEEAGIQPDYITGTSMGSIIGGLYAMGYTASELEKIALEQDWDNLIMDKLPRQAMSMSEKHEANRFILNFPLDGMTRISLPRGLVAGQNITALISRLTQPVHHIRDFSRLPIPFECIATDIETGEAVVLRKGLLSDALRASMSIPSMLTPVEVDGRLLVDGGLVRNFPVSDVRKMGADIVIGSDVGILLYDRQRLNSLVRIMQQSVSFLGAESTLQERKLTDVLILPDVLEYEITQFAMVDSMIVRGERSARDFLPELRRIAADQARYPRRERFFPVKELDSLNIVSISMQGRETVSADLIRSKLQIKEGTWITPNQLDEAILRVYGTRYFERVTYRLDPVRGGVHLLVRIKEKEVNAFRVGGYYDTELKSSILLGLIFRNFPFEGSRSSIRFRLGDNLGFDWRDYAPLPIPGLGIEFIYHYDELNIPIRMELDDEPSAVYEAASMDLRGELQTVFSNNFLVAAGLAVERSRLDAVYHPEDWVDPNQQNDWICSYARLAMDTLDDEYFPSRGYLLEAELREFNNDILGEEVFNPFTRLYLHYKKVVPLSRRFVAMLEYHSGEVHSELAPPERVFYLGGFNSKIELIPFTGLDMGYVQCLEFSTLSCAFRFEIHENIFLTLQGSGGRIFKRADPYPEETIDLYGLGLGLSASTIIGPVEFILMNNDRSRTGNFFENVSSFFRIGYPF